MIIMMDNVPGPCSFPSPNDDIYDDEDAYRKDWGGANVRFPDAVAAPAEY